MGNTWRAPEPTDEQKWADELKAAGLMRDSFNGQIRPIPEPGKPKTQEELDAGWAAIREQAAANTARREDAERVQRATATAEMAGVAAEKQAAWQRYQALAGRNADGGLVADGRLFDAEWQKHLAQRAIADTAAPG